jgi:hypothetical protein
VSATLIAEEPILSPSVWTTIASGKRKEKHGILDFNVSSLHVRCKRIWDILQEKGYVTGTYGHFVTWPPHQLNGFNVPGILAATDETYPPELSFLRGAFDFEGKSGGRALAACVLKGLKAMRHGLHVSDLFQILWFLVSRAFWLRDPRLASLRRSLLGVRFQFRFFMRLFQRYRPDYSFFHAHAIDGASHRCWRYMEPEKFPGTPPGDIRKYGDAIFRAYEQLDRLLGTFLKRFGDTTTCVVLSDHGIGPGEGKIEPLMYKVDVQRLLALIGAEGGYRAIDRGFNVIYLRPRSGFSDRIPSDSDVLSRVAFERTGKPLFETKPQQNSIFLIERFDPDTIAGQLDERILIAGKAYPAKEVIVKKEIETSGWHHPEGIFVIRGDGIRKGTDIGRIEQPAITPTLLYLYGLPAAEDMDGKIIEEVFTEESIRANPPEYIDSYEAPGGVAVESGEVELTEEVQQKLRDLGYFS